MPNDETSSPDELPRRRRWFDEYCHQLDEHSVVHGPEPGRRFQCPCCRFFTLSERGGFEICQVCYWEDDGQDDHDAAVIRGGPNGALSLEQARKNYLAFGAFDEGAKKHVRPPRSDERTGAG